MINIFINNDRKKINQLKKIISSPNRKIYFVPTMGNLHDGHLSLLEYAQKKKQFLIVSIFVNPLQFDSKKDFKNILEQ